MNSYKFSKEEYEDNSVSSIIFYNIGKSYYNGKGCKQNFSKAFDYFKLASDNGDTNAQHGLAVCLTLPSWM
jgi:TPR repeat protein